jgi:hypothetical protein
MAPHTDRLAICSSKVCSKSQKNMQATAEPMRKTRRKRKKPNLPCAYS